jgi:NAD(P)-dependent dehydrogenase (short-subunit alcohol dehydrogenase family)
MNISGPTASSPLKTVLVAGEGALARIVTQVLTASGAQVAEHCDAVDSVVCCVTSRPGMDQQLADVDDTAFKAGLDASLGATFRLSRQALPPLLARSGSLVYCVAGDDDICLQAVQTLMRSIVYQYGPQGVRANLVKVGGDLQAAAALVQFLVSDDASFVNGATL